MEKKIKIMKLMRKIKKENNSNEEKN